jgi:hypothetical protein
MPQNHTYPGIPLLLRNQCLAILIAEVAAGMTFLSNLEHRRSLAIYFLHHACDWFLHRAPHSTRMIISPCQAQLLKVVLFRGGLVPSIEPLKKYWVSEAMVLGMGWTKECIVL